MSKYIRKNNPKTNSVKLCKSPKCSRTHSLGECCADTYCYKTDCKYSHPNGRICEMNCDYGFNCIRRACRYIHPEGRRIDTTCQFGYHCIDSACLYVHLDGKMVETKCKYGFKCRNPDCGYLHPEGRMIDIDCKYGKSCTRSNCLYKHPEGKEKPQCRNGDPCGKKKCAFKHNDKEDFRKNSICRYGKACEDDECAYNHDIDTDPMFEENRKYWRQMYSQELFRPYTKFDGSNKLHYEYVNLLLPCPSELDGGDKCELCSDFVRINEYRIRNISFRAFSGVDKFLKAHSVLEFSEIYWELFNKYAQILLALYTYYEQTRTFSEHRHDALMVIVDRYLSYVQPGYTVDDYREFGRQCVKILLSFNYRDCFDYSIIVKDFRGNIISGFRNDE